jgi:hypothetical protein
VVGCDGELLLLGLPLLPHAPRFFLRVNHYEVRLYDAATPSRLPSQTLRLAPTRRVRRWDEHNSGRLEAKQEESRVRARRKGALDTTLTQHCAYVFGTKAVLVCYPVCNV